MEQFDQMLRDVLIMAQSKKRLYYFLKGLVHQKSK